MGFASHLQSRSSHEALVSVQDAELRLLENMKRCLSLRVKCDREYAIAINSIFVHAQKIEHSEDLKGSLVTKAWSSIINETEALGHLVKQNADYLATRTLETLNNLIAEKRALRKHYVEEHGRIHFELSRLQESVEKTKSDYEKHMEVWKIAKAKYEDMYIKGRQNRKLDEAKEKYIKATRKLHRIHNDYVLLLCEAAEYEQRLRNILLPDLLEYQQTVLQESIETWRTVLKEYTEYTDFSCEVFQSVQYRMKQVVEVITGEDEYREFSLKNKSLPLQPVVFNFDDSLLQDYTGNLKPCMIAVDSFTYEGLKTKIEDVRNKITQLQNDIKQRETQMGQYENEMAALRKTPDTALTISVKKRAVDILKKQIGELKCQEEVLRRVWDVLDGPLSSVGPNGPPAGLELDEGSLKRDDDASSVSSSVVSRSAKQVIDRLWSQIHRRQGPNGGVIGTGSSHISLNSSPKLPTAVIKYDPMKLNPNKSLQDEDWFHGVLPREEVVRLLVNDGDYLVRQTFRNEESQIVLSVCWNGHKHFIVQTTLDSKYRFEGIAFSSIQELVVHQHHSGQPVTNRSGAILKRPIFRERWELNNDDVVLVEKIGRGNFGDVYKAVLRPCGMDIAVKTCRMNLPDEQKKKFLQEGRILKQYDHPNIVKFIGICVQKQPIMIVMELVPGGSLLNFLRTNGISLGMGELLKMCLEAAAGMEYLESKGCIHRDLAARNCLVGNNNMVKISDFGMSREEEEYIVSDGMKQIPIKWTAPEALNYGKYTSSCDVWSYGVLMWEVLSLGSTPYCGLTNNRTRELLDTGYRLPSPDGTPGAVYELMLRCWDIDPERRPHFEEIRSSLEIIATDYRSQTIEESQ